MARQQIATLTTDFGMQGPYVGAMKGVILQICPQAQIIDITHDIPSHDLLAAAFVLAQSLSYYPPGTVHVVVVDPGVGTDRAILAADYADQIVIFPDNGVITLVERLLPLKEIRVCCNTQYVPSEVSGTFHGRDIMAPLAGRILNGLSISVLGPRPGTYKLFDLPEPTAEEDRITGQVMQIDKFGNLMTNIPGPLLRQVAGRLDAVRTTCGDKDAGPLARSYGFVEPGTPLVVFNSMDMVEVAVNQGRADEFFDAEVGTQVVVIG